MARPCRSRTSPTSASPSSEIARLEDLRLACLEERIEADLACGRHAALVGELEALVREHPLRERLRAQLMLALYRSGRQAEALEAYQDAREALVEELGIEPGAIAARARSRRSSSRIPRWMRRRLPSRMRAAAVAAEVETSCAPTRRRTPARSGRPSPPSRGIGVATEHGDQLDPEVLRRVLTRAFGEVTAAVEAHGGTIETTAGRRRDRRLRPPGRPRGRPATRRASGGRDSAPPSRSSHGRRGSRSESV